MHDLFRPAASAFKAAALRLLACVPFMLGVVCFRLGTTLELAAGRCEAGQ